MSKRRKFLIICGVIIFVGFVLSGIGISMGGSVTSVALGSQGLEVITPQEARNGKLSYKKENLDVEAFTEVKIDASYANISIERSNHYGIEYKISNKSTISYDIKNHALEVKEGSPSNGVGNGFNFYLFGGIHWLFGEETEDQYITIYVPEGVKLGDVTIVCDSGNTIMEGFSTKTLEIKNEYGDLVLHDISSKSIQLLMDSGNAKLEAITAESLTAQLEYGNCDMRTTTVNKKIQLTMDSGNASLENVTADECFVESAYGDVIGSHLMTKEMELKLDSGNIELDGVTLDTLDIESEYGNVEIELTNPVSVYRFDLFTDYGEVEVNRQNMGTRYNTMENQTVEKWIKGYCDSGNITIKEKK